jgi:hypothetical protein
MVTDVFDGTPPVGLVAADEVIAAEDVIIAVEDSAAMDDVMAGIDMVSSEVTDEVAYSSEDDEPYVPVVEDEHAERRTAVAAAMPMVRKCLVMREVKSPMVPVSSADGKRIGDFLNREREIIERLSARVR